MIDITERIDKLLEDTSLEIRKNRPDRVLRLLAKLEKYSHLMRDDQLGWYEGYVKTYVDKDSTTDT